MTDSANTTELVQRGKAAARVGRLDEAREYLGRAVELAPENIDAWLSLAAVEDDPAQKVACFEKILALEPDNVEAHWVLAWVLVELNDREGAAREFRKVIELAPGSDRATEAEKALGRLEQ